MEPALPVIVTVQSEVSFRTRQRSTLDITEQVAAAVADSRVETGLVHVFLQHTSASLMLCENADPDVRRDLEAFFQRLVPDGDELFVHRAEGDDDMSAHVRSVITHNDLTLPVRNGQLVFGTWQGLYLWEHRYRGRDRNVVITVQGEPRT